MPQRFPGLTRLPTFGDEDVVIIQAVRTPIGKAKRGSFHETTPDVLLGAVLQAIIQKTGLSPTELGEICVGNVLMSGASGGACFRMAQFCSGFPYTVPLSTVSRQCSSGLQAVANIAAGIQAGRFEVGIGAGVESMTLTGMMDKSNAPKADWTTIKAFPDAVDCMTPMGVTSENVAERFGVTRKQQDEFSVESHRRAAYARSNGVFIDEIAPVQIKGGMTITSDDGIRPSTTIDGLSKLRPAFKKSGSTTAGNSSQVSDGAAAVLLAKGSAVRRLGLVPLAVFRSYSVVGVPPSIMGIGPSVAIPKALRNAGVDRCDVDVYEINEAFASQAVYCVNALGLDMSKVNPNGGAIALGHPLGCTGARQIATLVHELRRRGGGTGVVSMCIGTGMGAAAVIEVLPQKSRL